MTYHISTLSLHDALPISRPARKLCRSLGASAGDTLRRPSAADRRPAARDQAGAGRSFDRGGGVTDLSVVITAKAGDPVRDRKSTRLNSSHVEISYAVFCL